MRNQSVTSMRHGSIVGAPTEPTMADVHSQFKPSNVEAAANASKAKTANNTALTGASSLTVRQSILPVALVTVLFFLWGFAYGTFVHTRHFASRV